MKKILLLFFLFSMPFTLHSQSIELLNGYELFYSKIDKGDEKLSHRNIDNRGPHYKLRLGLKPLKNKAIQFVFSYHTVSPYASLLIGTNEELQFTGDGPALYISGGSAKTRVHRIGIGGGYSISILKGKVQFLPRLILNSEISVQTWDTGQVAYGISGRYEYQLYAYSNPGFQIVPEFDVPTFIKIYKGLSLVMDYSFLLGNRPFMYIEADYAIEGVQQPFARFYNDGTAHHLMVGLNFQFSSAK